MLKLLGISLLLLQSVYGANTRKSAEAEKALKSLKPGVVSEKYDNKTVALEFDKECLNIKGSTVDQMSAKLLLEYPCLSLKFERSKSFYYHGTIQRGYYSIDMTNATCLNVVEIDWNDYCIYQITYDMLLNLHSVQCSSDIINNIQYSGTKKPYAWHLDSIDGVKDNVYKKPDISVDGNDHGIDIWILDSGVYAGHSEFYSGQIVDEDSSFGTSGKHGTATASCASGSNYGASKGFTIHDYPVCRSSTGGCSFSYIDQGLNKALTYMKATGKRSVISMSLGSSGASLASYWGKYYDGLFEDIIEAGGIIVVSSGNDNADACNYWFSYSEKVISVGAHDSLLKRSSFSNYGPCVDIYAPGTSLPVAASETDPNYVTYMSGTSFAAPLIAGVVANMLYEDITRTKDQIVALLQSNSYTISNCASGYCLGAYYQCHNVTDAPVTTASTQAIKGCCTSVRNTARLNRYCRPLSSDECTQGRNSEYCFMNATMPKSECESLIN